jgi:hypothetical protein
VNAARGTQTAGQIAARLRRFDHMEHASPSWVSMASRGLLDLTERAATAIAAALGVGLSDILPDPAPERVRVAMMAEDLAALHALYGTALEHLGVTVPLDPPTAAEPLDGKPPVYAEGGPVVPRRGPWPVPTLGSDEL